MSRANEKAGGSEQLDCVRLRSASLVVPTSRYVRTTAVQSALRVVLPPRRLNDALTMPVSPPSGSQVKTEIVAKVGHVFYTCRNDHTQQQEGTS